MFAVTQHLNGKILAIGKCSKKWKKKREENFFFSSIFFVANFAQLFEE